MAVKIAHAVVNDKGTTKCGVLGDQGYNGKEEVRFARWYAKNDNGATWEYRIRPRNPEIAEQAAQMAETVVLNQKIGYGQESALRNTIYTEAIAHGGDLSQISATCDCSSMILAIFALLIPGFPHVGSTATMVAQFGQFKDYFEISRDERDLFTDLHAKRGDVYLRRGHVLIVLSNGPEIRDTPPPQPEAPAAVPETRIIMDGIKKWCNVRKGPGTEYEKIGIAKVNEEFTVSEAREEWYCIDFHGQPGWVFYEFASEMLEGNT